MKLRATLLLAAALACVTPAIASAPGRSPAPGDAATLDPLLILPPPPADGSPAQQGELRELHMIQAQRSAERFRQAQADARRYDAVAIYAGTLGPRFNLANLPATARVVGRLTRAQAVVKTRGKDEFKRRRPWASDPTLKGCDHSGDAPNTSYPSGHSTLAFSLGVLLADLMPEHAGAILSRASDYATSRMVCGVHYRSDIVGGQVLGASVTELFLHDPANQADLAAARSELRAAGL